MKILLYNLGQEDAAKVAKGCEMATEPFVRFKKVKKYFTRAPRNKVAHLKWLSVIGISTLLLGTIALHTGSQGSAFVFFVAFAVDAFAAGWCIESINSYIRNRKNFPDPLSPMSVLAFEQRLERASSEEIFLSLNKDRLESQQQKRLL